MNLHGYQVHMTTKVFLSQWRRIEWLTIILWIVQKIPICMGNRTQCLNITSQVWLTIVNTTQNYHNKFYMLQTSGFKGQEINVTSSINLSFCGMWITNQESPWVHWQQGKSEKSQVLISISQGDVIDWSPFGSLKGKYSHSELRWKWYSWNGTVENSAYVNKPIWRHGAGMSGPLLQFGNSIRTNLWKLAHAFHPLKAWEGKTLRMINILLSFFFNC